MIVKPAVMFNKNPYSVPESWLPCCQWHKWQRKPAGVQKCLFIINFRDSQWSSLKRQDHFHYFVSNFISHCSHGSCFARGFSPLQLNLGIHNETFWWNISVFERLCCDCVYAPFVFCECSVPETYWHEHSLKMNFKDAYACHHGNWKLNSNRRPAAGMIVCFIQFGYGSGAMWIIWIVTEQLQWLWLAETSLPFT